MIEAKSPCPVCAEAAEVEALHAGMLDVRCDWCGPFTLSAAALRVLVVKCLETDDRRWLSERIRAEYDTTCMVEMVFTSRLLAWLDERAVPRRVDDAGAAQQNPARERGQQLRQRQARITARAASQLDRAAVLNWRAQEAVEESRAVRHEARRVRLDGLGPVFAARVVAGNPNAVFGVGLQRARRSAGMTQEMVGAHVGKPATWVSSVERGDKRLDAALMCRLAEAVGCELDGLLAWPDRDEQTMDGDASLAMPCPAKA